MLQWIVLAAQLVSAVGLTKQEVAALVPQLRSVIQGPLVGTVLRLSFHDCAGRAGCDGCLDTSLKENAGLDIAINALKPTYTKVFTQLSLADFWALSGIVAVNVAIEKSGSPVPSQLLPSNFRWGRKNCTTSPISKTDTATDFPSAFLGTAGVTSYFSSRFNFTEQQTVAIMGAHNLGRAHTQFSGFNGAWKGATDVLDNGYYASLQTLNWVQYAYTTNQFQWVRPPPPPPPRGPAPIPQPTPMLLDADVALFRNIAPSNTNGVVACNYGNCPAASTAPLVRDYANRANLATFHQAFAKVFIAMLEVCGRPPSAPITACSTAFVQ